MEHQFTLPAASDEQIAIATKIATHNLVVDSIAGSGKTTTVLHLAKQYPEKSILLLTYNAKLRLETREKCEVIGIDNVTSHTYHSMCVRYLSKDCCTDQGIINNIDKPMRDFKYDVIVIDEAQDLSFLYMKVASKAIEKSQNPWICVIGDRYQSIYEFNGADNRFIIHADKIFNSDREWDHLKLSTSYRITNQMAAFVNNCALGKDRLHAVKNGCKVRYYLHGYGIFEAMNEIKEALKKYRPDDIFVLAPSVRSKNDRNPVRMLSNELSKSKIPVFVPVNDQVKLDEDILKGKVVFSSFHQSKGLERHVTLVLGFDSSYYEFYNKTADPNQCPNEMYVALTRAKSELVLFHSNSKDHFNWLAQDLLHDLADVKGYMRKTKRENVIRTKIAVTELTRHQTSMVINKCMNLIDREIITPPGDIIDIPIKIEQYNSFGDLTYEDVSDINGISIPSYREYVTTGGMTIAREIGYKIVGELTPSMLLEVASKYNAEVSGFHFKVNQINEYNWLEQEALDLANIRLSEVIPNASKFEVAVSATLLGKTISGRIDAMSDNTVYEFKCTTELTPEHIIQLAIYAYMYGKDNDYILYNILSGEQIRIKHSEKLEEVIKMLLCNKFHRKGKLSDEEFFSKVGKEIAHDAYCYECADY